MCRTNILTLCKYSLLSFPKLSNIENPFDYFKIIKTPFYILHNFLFLQTLAIYNKCYSWVFVNAHICSCCITHFIFKQYLTIAQTTFSAEAGPSPTVLERSMRVDRGGWPRSGSGWAASSWSGSQRQQQHPYERQVGKMPSHWHRVRGP